MLEKKIASAQISSPLGKKLACMGLAALLAACSVGPDYVRPTMDIPTQFKENAGWKVAEPRDQVFRERWWEIFGIPELNALEERVSISNQNLRAAEARYRQARALVQQSRAAFFPTLSGNVSTTRSGVGSDSVRNGSQGAGARTSGTQHSLSFDASWEADVWGRVRRSVESSEASAQASAADLEALRLSLQAELAQNYFRLRALDTQKQLFDDTVAAYQKSLELTLNRYQAGVAAKADVAQAQTQLKSAQAQAIDLDAQRAQLEHAIALLVGEAPSSFSLPRALLTAPVPQIPVGLPSELLERRPDIAAAERRVAAANAQIGVAEAAYFPSLSLSASAGFQSSSFAKWLSSPNLFWAVGPALAQVIFDGGLRRGRTEEARGVFDETVANYRQTVLSSFQEVEDNLAILRYLEQEAEVQQEAVQFARESVTLATNQYRAGVVTYLNVVAAQTTALANERAAVDILSRRLAAGVVLVKAVGGGWDASELTGRETKAGTLAGN